MPSFKVSRKAQADLIAIGRYTNKQWGVSQRNHYLRQLDDSFNQLAENPEPGTSCDFILKGYRKFPQGSHLIFYKQNSKNSIVIIRVLHQNMDVKSIIT
jgi:toxin ParE1/3/4